MNLFFWGDSHLIFRFFLHAEFFLSLLFCTKRELDHAFRSLGKHFLYSRQRNKWILPTKIVSKENCGARGLCVLGVKKASSKYRTSEEMCPKLCVYKQKFLHKCWYLQRNFSCGQPYPWIALLPSFSDLDSFIFCRLAFTILGCSISTMLVLFWKRFVKRSEFIVHMTGKLRTRGILDSWLSVTFKSLAQAKTAVREIRSIDDLDQILLEVQQLENILRSRISALASTETIYFDCKEHSE